VTARGDFNMKMRLTGIVASSLVFAMSGCSQLDPPQVPTKQPYQRFLPISVPIPKEPSNPNGLPWVGAFALDTKTGQLCWTYPIVNHTENVMFPSAPNCVDLLKRNP
jgi:hypothetical protein